MKRKRLGLPTIDNKVTFKSHIKILCKKSRQGKRGVIKAIKLSLMIPRKELFSIP